MFPPASETETGEKAAKEEAAVVENTTPDYAAGLVSTQVPMITSLKYSWCILFLFCHIFPRSAEHTLDQQITSRYIFIITDWDIMKL